MIICTGLEGVSDACKKYHPSHIVSICSPGSSGWDEMSFPCIKKLNAVRLDLTFHDMIEEDGSLIGPSHHDVEKLIQFARLWQNDQQGERPILLHCQLGISRSTAGVLIVLATLNPQAAPADLAALLYKNAPASKPNLRVISLADSYLALDGSLYYAALSLHQAYDFRLKSKTFTVPGKLQ